MFRANKRSGSAEVNRRKVLKEDDTRELCQNVSTDSWCLVVLGTE